MHSRASAHCIGHYDEALVDYVVAIDRDPKLTYCYFNRGSLYLTLGEYQKAINDFTEAPGERRNDAVALTRARASPLRPSAKRPRRLTISVPHSRSIRGSKAQGKASTES